MKFLFFLTLPFFIFTSAMADIITEENNLQEPQKSIVDQVLGTYVATNECRPYGSNVLFTPDLKLETGDTLLVYMHNGLTGAKNMIAFNDYLNGFDLSPNGPNDVSRDLQISKSSNGESISIVLRTDTVSGDYKNSYFEMSLTGNILTMVSLHSDYGEIIEVEKTTKACVLEKLN